jgi:hypothetical protein
MIFKAVGSSPDDVNIFSLPNSSSCTMVLGSTQPLTEMDIRNHEYSLGLKGGQRVRLAALPTSVRRLSRENVGASTSHNPTVIQG